MPVTRAVAEFADEEGLSDHALPARRSRPGRAVAVYGNSHLTIAGASTGSFTPATLPA